MSGQAWSITIVPGSPCASFEVDAYGQSGSNLVAQTNDMVSWNNQTDGFHQPVETDSSYNPTTTTLSDRIDPWSQSTPGYIITQAAGTTVYYCCMEKGHENERGTITVID